MFRGRRWRNARSDREEIDELEDEEAWKRPAKIGDSACEIRISSLSRERGETYVASSVM